MEFKQQKGNIEQQKEESSKKALSYIQTKKKANINKLTSKTILGPVIVEVIF